MKKFDTPILVTRPYLPSLEQYKEGLEEIWSNLWLTNNGPVLQRFHSEISSFLDISENNMSLFNNGTLALEIIFHAMGLSGGEVITTPFTFVATAHAIKRIGGTPVFADIDPETLCLSPESVEKKITSRTKAIVPVHVYGHPCDVEGFQRLGEKYGIPIIYDSAHAFGVKINGKTIAEWGDANMFSFHSTKLFHSIEGGLLTYKDCTIKEQVDNLRNFAIKSDVECVDVGTNAKMNEFQALMGSLVLKEMSNIIEKRKQIYSTYAKVFSNSKDITLLPTPSSMYGLDIEHNWAYCPILFKDFETRERVYLKLRECNVFARRYFYPLLTDFAPYIYAQNTCPIAEDIAKRVLTIPTYHGLSSIDAIEITKIILETI